MIHLGRWLSYGWPLSRRNVPLAWRVEAPRAPCFLSRTSSKLVRSELPSTHTMTLQLAVMLSDPHPDQLCGTRCRPVESGHRPWQVLVLAFWGAGVLGCRCSGVQVFWGAGVLGCIILIGGGLGDSGRSPSLRFTKRTELNVYRLWVSVVAPAARPRSKP
ncbi:hypothetical protein M440DRAFT_164886 [Trichoderma longibrachiatum ATCC 18648]|uniref:Uncharacterized protein n=1 Tax=Trichoderma longibrachiatum ATCC 18648 TaxID=983965 RepID=A0A2T4BSN1_TRILO|nr:hypothetical protein M440DRAFT_164886 [Trichoderma longibrachiatum ATCC 18648]